MCNYNSPTPVLGLRCEMPDSSMVSFTVEAYNAAALKRQAIFNKKIIGIGVAFPNGEKKTIGNFLYDDRKIYNEHYLEQQELMKVFSPNR